MRPIRNSCKTCRRFRKPNHWPTVSLSVSEIQEVGSRGGRSPKPSTSIFRTNISINHPLKPLLDKSLDTILQAVSPRTLQTYVTAWKCFKSFHLSYNIPFPEFSLLSITSFISFLNSIKSLQVSSIKSYISGIQFFHKLLYGAPSPEINNSQTALLIRGIQRKSKHTASPSCYQQGSRQQIFSSHSFRIGAATSAAQKGLTKHQIQTLGRWSSEAFQSYIRTDQFHIKSAHQTLVS